ncbi:MAG: hypothetical protein GF317_03390 [Candidatus Lokiarchaeota archaeon]|nr:hypothetical protein [Candidatus Lokiarchaeota archaeon]MBD3350049.1 hypothetical protein [Candidatus Lokiarchaeota archaeon]
MQYLSVKNLEKYHPGYKDRTLQWAKIYFKLVQGDPDFEMVLDETDKWRYVTFILLELYNKKPTPLDPVYLTRKGFDLKKRKIDATIQSLRNFVEIRNETVTDSLQFCNVDKDKEEDKEEDKEKDIVQQSCTNTSKQKTKPTPDPALKRVIDHICKSWRLKRGAKYPFQAKHAKLIQGLCRHYEYSGVMALWDVYLGFSDDFFRKTGYSIEAFVTSMPKLLDTGWKSIKQKYEHEDNLISASDILKKVKL